MVKFNSSSNTAKIVLHFYDDNMLLKYSIIDIFFKLVVLGSCHRLFRKGHFTLLEIGL